MPYGCRQRRPENRAKKRSVFTSTAPEESLEEADVVASGIEQQRVRVADQGADEGEAVAPSQLALSHFPATAKVVAVQRWTRHAEPPLGGPS